MKPEVNKRVEKLRADIQAERQPLNELAAAITGDLRRMLKPASSLLQDADLFFLDPDILAEPRTDAALSKWLGQADRVLGLARQHRQQVEELVKQYGVGARLVG